MSSFGARVGHPLPFAPREEAILPCGVPLVPWADFRHLGPQVSTVGLFWAVLAIIANSTYTIWGQTKQRELGVEPMQLLLYQAPLSAGPHPTPRSPSPLGTNP